MNKYFYPNYLILYYFGFSSCSQSVSFSIHLIWLLDTFNPRVNESMGGRALIQTHQGPSSEPILTNLGQMKRWNCSDQHYPVLVEAHGDDESKNEHQSVSIVDDDGDNEFNGQKLRDLLLPIDATIWYYFNWSSNKE